MNYKQTTIESPPKYRPSRTFDSLVGLLKWYFLSIVKTFFYKFASLIQLKLLYCRSMQLHQLKGKAQVPHSHYQGNDKTRNQLRLTFPQVTAELPSCPPTPNWAAAFAALGSQLPSEMRNRNGPVCSQMFKWNFKVPCQVLWTLSTPLSGRELPLPSGMSPKPRKRVRLPGKTPLPSPSHHEANQSGGSPASTL